MQRIIRKDVAKITINFLWHGHIHGKSTPIGTNKSKFPVILRNAKRIRYSLLEFLNNLTRALLCQTLEDLYFLSRSSNSFHGLSWVCVEEKENIALKLHNIQQLRIK